LKLKQPFGFSKQDLICELFQKKSVLLEATIFSNMQSGTY